MVSFEQQGDKGLSVKRKDEMLDLGEKRRHSRINLSIPVSYKQLHDSNKPSNGALTKDLSEGGVKFNADKFVSLSCRMIMEINLPSVSKPLRAISKVAWIKKLPLGDSYEIGNQFLDMTREDKKTISNFLKTAISQISA